MIETSTQEFRKKLSYYSAKAEEDAIKISRRYRKEMVMISLDRYEELIGIESSIVTDLSGSAKFGSVSTDTKNNKKPASENLCEDKEGSDEGGDPGPDAWLANFMKSRLCFLRMHTDPGSTLSVSWGQPIEKLVTYDGERMCSHAHARAQLIYTNIRNIDNIYIKEVEGRREGQEPPLTPPSLLYIDKSLVKQKMNDFDKNKELSTENDKTPCNQERNRMQELSKKDRFDLMAEQIREVFIGLPIYDSEDIFILSHFLKSHELSVEAALSTRIQMNKKKFMPRYWQSTISWFRKYLEMHPPTVSSPSSTASSPISSNHTLYPEGCKHGDIRHGSTGTEYVYVSREHEKWFEIHYAMYGNLKGFPEHDPHKTDFTFIAKARYEKILKELGINE